MYETGSPFDPRGRQTLFGGTKARSKGWSQVSCAKQWLQSGAMPRLIPIRRVPFLLRDLAVTSRFDLSHPNPHRRPPRATRVISVSQLSFVQYMTQLGPPNQLK